MQTGVNKCRKRLTGCLEEQHHLDGHQFLLFQVLQVSDRHLVRSVDGFTVSSGLSRVEQVERYELVRSEQSIGLLQVHTKKD
jgi:hypothetical protein